MSNLELFVSQFNVFSGIAKAYEKARYVIFGIPFDVTSTYRTGARFGPTAIRQASLNIETYSFRSGMDVEDLPLHDAGDLNVSTDTRKTIDMAALVTSDIIASGKKPIVIGGEHTVTLGIMKGLSEKAKNTAYVSFDAHLDLRKEFMGLKLSHTTFNRVIKEEVNPAKMIEVGIRSVCKEELTYAKKSGIDIVTSQQIRKDGVTKVQNKLKKMLEPYENLYLSVDMDILDPAYAPAAQNPEPEGVDTTTLLDIVCSLCDKRVLGFDVLEIAPSYDQGVSAITAAKIIFEMLCQLEKSY